MKPTKSEWTVLRTKRSTTARINLYRAKKVEKLGRYMTQDQTLNYMLDQLDKKA